MKVMSLFAGKPKPFGPRGSPSSIVKHSVDSLTVTYNGAEEDEQGNKKLHGGPEMALHQFSLDSYRMLCTAYPDLSSQFMAGSIGENISVEGMNDRNVYIGDTYQFGEAVLQVNSPRAPCVKINQKYGQKGIDLFMAKEGITGWYFRVLTPGQIRVGDDVTLIERVQQDHCVADVMIWSKSKETKNPIRAKLAATQGLAQEWVLKFQK